MYFSLKNLAIGAKYKECAILAGLGRTRAGDIITNVKFSKSVLLGNGTRDDEKMPKPQ